MQYRRSYPLILLAYVGVLAAFAGCSNRYYRTRLDCVDICKEKGLRFVEVVKGDTLVNTRTGETKAYDYCRCE